MAMPFSRKTLKKRDQILVIDLGTRTTKALHLRRKGAETLLSNFTLLDAPIYERNITSDLLGEHLKAVTQDLGGGPKYAAMVLGVGDSILRQTELPMIPPADMRAMLKHNTKNYLQQDLPDYAFDCYIIPPSSMPAGGPSRNLKVKVVVAGARKQLLDEVQSGARTAGLQVEYVVPGLIGPVNAFEEAFPEAFKQEIVALVDLGFKNSSISILNNGELALNRVVGIGGDKLTSGLAESMGISYAEAEGIKIGMAEEVQGVMQPLLSPLGRELRASIDFFEHQQDKTVTQVYISGGPARSEFIIQNLQSELMVPCQSWNPTSFMRLALPPRRMGEIEMVAPQLGVGVGAGLTAL